MRLSQARGACASLIWRDYDQALYIEAQRKLVAQLVSCSPRVSSAGIGEIILDAEGLTYSGGESKFCRELLKQASLSGYTEACIGVADCSFVASIAAKTSKRRWHMIPRGQDKAFLANISVNHLPIKVDVLNMLDTLGVKTIGEFRQFDLEEVRQRFGSEIEKAYELATGIDKTQPMLPMVEKNFQCLLDLGGPIESLVDTIFVMKSLLHRLVLNLVAEGLCAEELTVCFYSDDDLFETRPIALVKPSNNSKFLLEVLRLSLEAKPLEKEFTALRLIVSKTVNESWEQLELASKKKASDLFKEMQGQENSSSFSSSFAYLLQRMQTRLGENAVVKPVFQDHHFPELAGRWQPVTAKERQVKEHESSKYAFNLLKERGVASGLVLKKFAAPQSALIELDDDKPVSLSFDGNLYKVVEITAPDRISGLWWDSPIRKSYYVCMLKGRDALASMVLLTYDHESTGWHVEGVYD